MDILQQYEQNRPVPISQSAQRRQPSEYGFLIRLVMKMSGGKIDNPRHAIPILLIAAGVISITSIIILVRTFGGGSSAQNQIPNVDQRQFMAPKP